MLMDTRTRPPDTSHRAAHVNGGPGLSHWGPVRPTDPWPDSDLRPPEAVFRQDPVLPAPDSPACPTHRPPHMPSWGP